MRVGAIFVVLLVATHALAAPAPHAPAPPTPPCRDCTLDVPAKRDGAIPLVVLLHGDRQHATTIASWWRKAVLARGWALLSLQCPRDLGCKDSFWAWGGDPAWVAAQVAAVSADVAIDPARVFLVGWSGGASWMGLDATAWEATFAAIVIHGGGQPPWTDPCPRALPAYFLVGDRNPLHRLARDLRTYFADCKQATVWDVVAGADHEGEERALSAGKAATILDWLAEHARTGS